VRLPLAVASLALLAACGQDEAPVEAQRIALDEASAPTAIIELSPDTTSALWTASADGLSVAFGTQGAPAMLTLECRLKDNPARLAVIRHAPARAGLQAMFPVIGNGRISRFKLDAVRTGDGWQWAGALPVADPLNDVFVGAGSLEATLPGGGSLIIAPSRIPSEFVNWCREGGRLQRAQLPDEPAATPSATPNP
jgi:hypothetical protein